MYGQEVEEKKDSRGVIDFTQAAQFRQARAREMWERIDSIAIGEGHNVDGWFTSWSDFAAANRLSWFAGRSSNVGPAYSNQDSERTDWAQDVYRIGMELIAPAGVGDLETDANDILNTQVLFQMLANTLSLRVVLSESDEIAKAPASHFPAGVGEAYPLVASSATPFVKKGSNGEPIVGNSWKFPVPIMLAAKSRITIEGQIDAPLRQAFAAISGPGAKQVPTGNPAPADFHRLPNWYVLRCTIGGPRYLQLRGARSSA